jgi:NADPH2:quinone reductase
MKALVCKAFGPAEELEIQDWPEPTAGNEEVIVDIQAAGLNFPDNLMINGLYQTKNSPPFIPGGEAAGVVSETGPGAGNFSVGDRVIIIPEGGAFAQRCAVPCERVIPIPAGLGFKTAAGFTVTYATSYHALRQSAALQEGETLLVLGAAGGVGSTAVEIGKAMGACVIAAASSEEKLEFARSVGADETINYTEISLRDAVKELTGGRGADVVYDPVGGDLAQQALRATAWHGRYLVIGFASGDIPQFPANLALLKEASVIGVWWGTWSARHPRESMQNMQELFAMLGEGRIRPQVTESWPLDQFLNAFQSITERRARGKIILQIQA